METFRKWQDEVIAGFNEKHWLAVDVSKVDQGYAKRYVDSHWVVRVIDDQGEEIVILLQTIQNGIKVIDIMSTTMGGMVQNLHDMGKEMEYYAAKYHQMERRFEVSNMFFLWQFFLLDKYFMFPNRRIRSLLFHILKFVSVF